MAKWRDVKKNRLKKEKEPIKQEPIQGSCASLPSRFKAFLTDLFLITTPITYVIMYLVLGGGDDFSQNRTIGWSMILLISALFITFFWYVKMKTPGMKAYGVRLVDAQTKQRVTFLAAIIRYIATLFAMISIFLLFTPFFNKEKKTFQDIISKTIIIDDK